MAELRYKAWGETRYTSGTTPTSFRYTGQRLDDSTGLYYYGARYYDAALGRFVQADTVVPEPGNPQSLNRYAYTLNNPLRFVDPSGMVECAAGDQRCWETEWYWKDRWYRAHGYGWDGSSGHWSAIIPAEFKDPGIFNETMEEAGINIRWQWGKLNDVMGLNIARGVVRFGQALAGGLKQLKTLLGGGATIEAGSLRGSPYAPPWQNNTVRILGSTNETWIQQTVVHELAHVIDWHNNFSMAWAKQNGALTDYAADFHPYPAIWEVWAEAVTVWVFGNKDPNSGVWTSSISLRRDMQKALTTQMDRLTVLLGGSR